MRWCDHRNVTLSAAPGDGRIVTNWARGWDIWLVTAVTFRSCLASAWSKGIADEWRRRAEGARKLRALQAVPGRLIGQGPPQAAPCSRPGAGWIKRARFLSPKGARSASGLGLAASTSPGSGGTHGGTSKSV
jgi:hypothetical protein